METTVETKSTAAERHLYDDIDGFTDEDLEKPNFPGKQSSEKVPFILSEVDNPPIVQVPSTINQYLREYQREGIAFLYRQYSCGKGAILADDMGLGKTVQVIGFISAVLGKTGTKMDIYGKFLSEHDTNKDSLNRVKTEKGTFLIVSPNSVLYNWHEELMTWGYFKIGKFHKNTRDETFQKAAVGKLDVVLTTYETLRNHWETLNRVKWLSIIMDEVQHLKDPKRAVTIASKSLNVKCRIGLTGTPLQNRLLDFWSVLDWANPGCLGDKEEFTYDFSRPIMQGQRFDGTKRELATGRKKTQEFQSMIDDWCLRRTKALIADQLPQKDQKVVFCPLSKLQEDIYKTLLQTNDVQLVLKQGEPCDCRSELTRGKCCYTVNEEGSNLKKLLLQCLRLFLKISNHAALLLPHVKQSDDQRKRAKAICDKVFVVHPEFEAASQSPSFELFSDSNFCGKMKVLDKLLKLFRQEKDKVLLFSYSTQLLDILEAYVISCGMAYRRLDGKTRGERRLDAVREFNTNPSIFLFLVSTKAGGVGLNLTSANIVIVFDPSWNPADDLQAEDRAYRIGQRRDVKVFRLISSGTVEENMYLRQIYKQQLANVAVEGNNERRYFTAVDGEKDKKGELFGIENLFALGSKGCSVSTDIFKRSAKIERGFQMTKYELQPKEDNEHKMQGEQTTSPPVLITEAEEENSYDWDEITSQFYGDGATHIDCLPNKSAGKLNHVELSSDTEEDNKKLKTNFTKVLDISDEIEKLNESLSPSYGTERQKRQKIKQGASPSKRRPISKDSQVNQILEECGVQHTHSNKMIIGTSEAENEMTSRAMKEVFDLGQYSQHPANCFAAVESDGEESDDIGDYSEQESNTKTEISDSKKPESDVFPASKGVQRKLSAHKQADGRLILFGETPKTIRFRQFTEISKAQGYKSDVEFARAVVSGNTTARLRMLMEYYKEKEYPDESIESFSQTISQELNTSKNSKENEEFTKMKGLVNQTRHLKKSTRQKSFIKVLKSPIVKPNKSNRVGKKRSKHLQMMAESNANETSKVSKAKQQHKNERIMETSERNKLKNRATVLLQSNANTSPCRIVDNFEHKNDQKQLVDIDQVESNLGMSQREGGNKLQSNSSDHEKCTKSDDKAFVEAISSAVSPAIADNECEDIFDDILTECKNAKCSKSNSSPESAGPSNRPLVSAREDGSQSSSFLDEFLLECALGPHDGTEIGLSHHKGPSNEKRLVEKTTSCGNLQTSIIDDLI